jgi:hypothetical protein
MGLDSFYLKYSRAYVKLLFSARSCEAAHKQKYNQKFPRARATARAAFFNHLFRRGI